MDGLFGIVPSGTSVRSFGGGLVSLRHAPTAAPSENKPFPQGDGGLRVAPWLSSSLV